MNQPDGAFCISFEARNVVQVSSVPHTHGTLEVYEVRHHKKQTFSMRAVLLDGNTAWFLIGTARFHYYAGYRELFTLMMHEFSLAH